MDFVTTVECGGSYPARIQCQNGASLEYSAPVEFGGMKGPITPEDAFIGSANMCFEIVFKRVSAGLGMNLLDFKCKAVGNLQTVDGFKKFVKISLYPEMRFAEGSRVENLQKAIEGTKKRCLVTSSMALDVEVFPKIVE